MSLVINSTLEYLQSRLNIPAARMQVYADKTIEQILEAEAAAGNQEAIKLAADMFTDPNQLVELFQLADPQNKLVIMNSMTSVQLEKLVPMLETDDLLQGLQFFTQDSLMDLLKDIPKEELIKTVFQLFSQRQVIEYMPEKELDNLLTGTDMNKNLLLDNLRYIPEMYLQQMLESVKGEEVQAGSAELIRQVGQLGDLEYKHAILNLQPTQKQQFTLAITSTDQKLYEKFNTDAYTHMISREREKDEIIKSMGVIKPEYLEKMMNKLPQDLLAIVTTQIDTDKFADALINKFPELLAKFVAG